MTDPNTPGNRSILPIFAIVACVGVLAPACDEAEEPDASSFREATQGTEHTFANTPYEGTDPPRWPVEAEADSCGENGIAKESVLADARDDAEAECKKFARKKKCKYVSSDIDPVLVRHPRGSGEVCVPYTYSCVIDCPKPKSECLGDPGCESASAVCAEGDGIDFAQCMDELGYACDVLEGDDDLLVCEPDLEGSLEGGGEVAPD